MARDAGGKKPFWTDQRYREARTASCSLNGVISRYISREERVLDALIVRPGCPLRKRCGLKRSDLVGVRNL